MGYLITTLVRLKFFVGSALRNFSQMQTLSAILCCHIQYFKCSLPHCLLHSSHHTNIIHCKDTKTSEYFSKIIPSFLDIALYCSDSKP